MSNNDMYPLAIAVPVSEAMERNPRLQIAQNPGKELELSSGVKVFQEQSSSCCDNRMQFALSAVHVDSTGNAVIVRNKQPIMFVVWTYQGSNRTLLLHDGPTDEGSLLAAARLKGEWCVTPDAVLTDNSGSTIGKIVTKVKNKDYRVYDAQGREIFRSARMSASRLAIKRIDTNVQVGTLNHYDDCCGGADYSVVFPVDMTIPNKLLLVACMSLMRIAAMEAEKNSGGGAD